MADAAVWRSAGRLSDGREIIYFDESPGLGRAEVADSRGLPAADVGAASAGSTGELRLDPLVGEQVIFAEQRQDRTFQPASDECPLCPSRPGRPTEIPADDYDVVVFGNRFPALTPATGGRCEVICFTSDHEASFADLSAARVRTVFEAWADRTCELAKLPGVRHVYCFENRGAEIGATLRHPHGQVYAFPFVPPRVARMAARASSHRAATGGNLFDELVESELADGRRIVSRNEHWVAFVPAAARWPFEVMIFPLQRVPSLVAVPDLVRDAFGLVYLDVLGRLDALFAVPMPYLAVWQQAPAGPVGPVGSVGPAGQDFGLHLHVMGVRRSADKLKYQAGTESSGAWSNDVLPEVAAAMLREAG